VVVELLAPRHEVLVADEPPAAVEVGEGLRPLREPVGLLEPARVSRGPVKLDVAVGDVRVVLEVPVDLGDSVAVGAKEAAPAVKCRRSMYFSISRTRRTDFVDWR